VKHKVLFLFLSAGLAVRADVITDPTLAITDINGLNPLFYTVDIFNPPDADGVSLGDNLSPQFVDGQLIVPTIPTTPTEPAPWPERAGDFTQDQGTGPSQPIILTPPPNNPPPDDPVATPEPSAMLGTGLVLAILAIARRSRPAEARS
jgi:hypothetical protein